MTFIPGEMRKLISGATASTSVAVPMTETRSGRHLMVFHNPNGGQGFCSVQLSPDEGTTVVPHHGNSRGFPMGDVSTSYCAIAYDCVGTVIVNLVAHSGEHDVWICVTD